MTSDDEWTTTPATIKTINNSIPSSGATATPSSPRRLFNLKLVNSYGNANMEPLVNEASDTIRLGGGGASSAAKSYIALDWHPRARPLFYNDKAAEEVSQDDASFHPGKTTTATAAAVKKQTLGLTECLKLYTSQVQYRSTVPALGEPVLPDPNFFHLSQIRIKEFKYFKFLTRKIVFQALGNMIRVVHPGSGS
jgi:hypothetical protein